MSLLTKAEIRRVEKRFPDGIESAAIVSLFQKKGERFSEPSLRKYVQLEMIPKSIRVGTKGRHKGSRGVYPVSVVRQINDIKRLLESGKTLEEVKAARVCLGGEVELLRTTTERVFGRLKDATTKGADKKKLMSCRKALIGRRQKMIKEIRELDKLAARIGKDTSKVARA